MLGPGTILRSFLSHEMVFIKGIGLSDSKSLLLQENSGYAVIAHLAGLILSSIYLFSKQIITK